MNKNEFEQKIKGEVAEKEGVPGEDVQVAAKMDGRGHWIPTILLTAPTGRFVATWQDGESYDDLATKWLEVTTF